MAMYLILILVGGIFLILSVVLYKKDFTSLSFLFNFGYFLSFVFAALNANSWGESIGVLTVLCFSFAVVSFTLTDYLCYSKTYFYRIKVKKNAKLKLININTYLLIFIIFVDLVALYLAIKDIERIAYISYDSSLNLIQNYKNNVLNSELSGNTISTIVAQTLRLIDSMALISVLVIINNFFYCKKEKIHMNKKKTFLLALPILFYLIEKYYFGERYTIIGFIISIIFAFLTYYFCYRKTKKISMKFLLLGFISMILVMLSFYFLRNFFGRNNDESLTEYLGFYIGAEIPLFEHYLNFSDPFYGSSNILNGILKFLNKIGFNFKVNNDVMREFVTSSTGKTLGNAYSALRTYYHDLGFLGVIVMPALLALIFRFWYERAKYFSFCKNKYFLFLLLLKYIYVIPLNFFTDYFFSKITFGWITDIIVLYILYYLFVIYGNKTSRVVLVVRKGKGVYAKF